MKVSKFIQPYQGSGKTSYRESQNRSGVYLIKENGSLVYVGYSGTNIYRTMYRHFQRWNHRQQEVVTYHHLMKENRYTVRLIYCTIKQAAALEKALIIKHRPRDNENKYRNYELTFYDKQTVETYNNTESEIFVIPF